MFMEGAIIAYNKKNIDFPITGSHYSGTCIMLFKGDIDLCNRLKNIAEVSMSLVVKKDKISDLVGKTMKSVINDHDEEIIFETIEGEKYKLYHHQSCCEEVFVEDICGDLHDLMDSPILLAEERTSEDFRKTEARSQTWTFYEIATIKGNVTIRWYGVSNGYYSKV
jgi:hypothetical protein